MYKGLRVMTPKSIEHQKRLKAELTGDCYVKVPKSDAPKVGDIIQTQSWIYDNPSTLKRDITNDEKYHKRMIENKNNFNYNQDHIQAYDQKRKVVCECKLLVVKVLDASTLEEISEDGTPVTYIEEDDKQENKYPEINFKAPVAQLDRA